jgi:hypothetical protein
VVDAVPAPTHCDTAIDGGDDFVAVVALVLALIQFVLVGFGVTVVGSSELRNVAFGLALLALGLLPIGSLSVPSRSGS